MTWRDDYRKCNACKREYRPKRKAQSYCSPHCKRAAAYGRERFAAGTVGARRRRLEASDKPRGFFLNRNNNLQTDKTYPFFLVRPLASLQGLQALGDAAAGQSSASHVLHRQAEIRMKRIEQNPPRWLQNRITSAMKEVA